MAQISMEVLLGSGDKSVKAQLELLQGVRVFEQEVGKAVYLRTFEDLKELREAKDKEGTLKGFSLSQAKEQLHI